MKQQPADRQMSSHSDTLFWFRANQSLLFRLNAACLAEKPQPDQGEKLVPNTFIMFVFLIYRIKSCSYSYPNLFSRTWWLLNIYKIIKISYQNRMESLIVWSLGHWTCLCHLLWCLLSYIILIYCISPKFISGKRFPFCQIIHCKLSIMVIVGTKWHKYLHGIHV
jgi:hypothetical protein